MKKTIYLWLIKLVSLFYVNKPKSGTVYLMSFGNNLAFIKALAKKDELLVCYQAQCQAAAKQLEASGIKTMLIQDGFGFAFKKLGLILTARKLFCDNYYAFLGGCLLDHHQVKVIQVWHANGAIKTFGLEEPRTATRSASDQRRFRKVYDQFDDYVVASPKMGQVFANSYQVSLTKMKVLGYPRSDRLFKQDWQKETKARLLAAYPDLRTKEVILYAPTYREVRDNSGQVALNLPSDFDEVVANLAPKQVLVIKLHPHLKASAVKLKQRYSHNPKVLWLDEFSTEEVLVITARLITDYSSVIFDYSLLPNAGQLIFYCYDLEAYAAYEGLQSDFVSWLPGPLVKSATELSQILAQPYQLQDLVEFNRLWNTQNDGQATERVLAYYYPR